MSEFQRYTSAMVAGHLSTCIAIEQRHGLYGYPPEIVCVGLHAFDEGRDVNDAVDEVISPEESEE